MFNGGSSLRLLASPRAGFISRENITVHAKSWGLGVPGEGSLHLRAGQGSGATIASTCTCEADMAGGCKVNRSEGVSSAREAHGRKAPATE
jgi:hypothetical protein